MIVKPGAKKLGRFLLIAAVVGGAYVGLNYYLDNKVKVDVAATVPTKVAINAKEVTTKVEIALPAANTKYQPTLLTIPWNATMGLHYASAGGLFDKHGVKLKVERQDDYGQMKAEMVKFALEVSKGNKSPQSGAAFAIIMGDGYAPFIRGSIEAMKAAGVPGQYLEVIAGIGYSRGEDKCMTMSTDPKKVRGSLIAVVKGDGDPNICLKWAGDNDVPVNADDKTWDADALNFTYVDSFTQADEKLISGNACEDRAVVSKGKRQGGMKKVCVNGTATWTPGDVNVVTQCYAVDKLGKQLHPNCFGIVALASTSDGRNGSPKEYMWQMPAIVIGNHQWMEENEEYVLNMLASMFEGGDMVRGNAEALMLAGKESARVYKEHDAKYWSTYYSGVPTKTAGGTIHLGGSRAIGLADNAVLFGLGGNDNLYKHVYTVYGEMNAGYYPDMITLPLDDYSKVVNTKYLEKLFSKAKNVGPVEKQVFDQNTSGEVLAQKNWSIEFASGRATFTPKASAVLDQLLRQLSVSGSSIQINGHTDNVGNPSSNLALSKQRAEAVKEWLMVNAGKSFPAERLTTRAYGDGQPVADNNTADGKAKNRRVEILMLK